jgi:squalene cyclase
VSALLSAGPAPSDDDLAKLVGGLLRCQGADGSFGAYVPPRAPRALVARDGEGCSSSVERAASAVWALSRVVRDRPALLKRAELGGLERAVAQGAAWIRRQQLPEGSWRGIRGVQHISGTLFAIRGLIAAGVPSIDPAIRKACAWLKAHQAPDGSWGERYSARSAGYVEHSDGQIVQTAWALIALLEAHEPEWDVLDRAARYLAREQLGSGEWPRQAPAATVFPGALADMSLDRSYFPVWALGLFEARRKLRNELIDEVKRQVAAE